MQQDLIGVFLHTSLAVWVLEQAVWVGSHVTAKTGDCVAKLLPGRFFSVSTFTSSVGKGRMGYGYISILGNAVCFGVSFFFLKWKHACPLAVSCWTAASYLRSVRVFLVTGTHDLPSSCLVRCRWTRGRPWKFIRAVPWETVE